MLSKPERRLRIKIWIVIAIAVSITGGAVFWSYESFKELTTSIERLSQPNEKLQVINNILQDFISAENNIQSYIITGNVPSARIYERQIEEARKGIATLKGLVKEDSTQIRRVDSLELIFQKKINYLNSFLVLKKERQATAFTKLALEQIEASTEDTARIEKEIYKETNQKKGKRPVTRKEVVQRKDTSKGLWVSLKRLFGNNPTVYDTVTKVGQDFFTYEDTSYDTSVIKSYNPDTVLFKVKQILAQAENMEIQMQQNLTQRELALLQQDQIFLQEIKDIIRELEKNERSVAQEKRNRAFVIATGSTRIIILIGLGGLIIGGVLITLITKDITRASYFRRKLEKAKLRAERLAKVKENFLANMSHEIRTPLNSILGFSRLLNESSLSDEQRKYMNAVSSSSDYLMELVNDILDYSKIESGKLQLMDAPFSIQELQDDVRSMFAQSAENKQLDFAVEVSSEVPNWLSGDVFRIKQIVNNLVSNALKFTQEGKVSVYFDGRWFKEQFYFHIKVEDTGVGIAKTELKKIFESFTQEESTTADQFGGTGLGLSICKQLSEAMGGSIQAQSEKNAGAVFTVKIPLEKVAGYKEVKESIDKSEEVFYDAHVVMLEDDHWNALLLETILKKYVSKLTIFMDPEEALKYMLQNSEKVDLLFTDLKMPKLSGEEFVKECRNAGMDCPAIAITAHLQMKQTHNLEEIGIQGVCTKPYKQSEIRDVLSRHLNDFVSEKVVEANQEKEINNWHNRVDLSDIVKFAGNDSETIQMLLRELVENNEEQVSLFQQYLDQQKWKELAALSHKMLPTYDHTKVFAISELLKSIELYQDLGNTERVEQIAHETVTPIKECLVAFKSVLQTEQNAS